MKRDEPSGQRVGAGLGSNPSMPRLRGGRLILAVVVIIVSVSVGVGVITADPKAARCIPLRKLPLGTGQDRQRVGVLVAIGEIRRHITEVAPAHSRRGPDPVARGVNDDGAVDQRALPRR